MAAADETVPGRSGRTVLCIDDHPANLRLVERILARRPDVILLQATNGMEGLALARQHLPDLVLLDLNLPDLSGEEVLRLLQAEARTQHVPVVIVSADPTRAHAAQADGPGARDILSKPFLLTDFVSMLDRHLK